MRNLNYELKQLCRRNRDGGCATQRDREWVLDQMANQLEKMGFRHLGAKSLKPKHVEALVERWKLEGLATGTIKNRMTELRWWAEKIDKQNVVARSNEPYGIANREYVTNVSKARELTAGDLSKITDSHTRLSLKLQAAFGLRRAGVDQDSARMGGPRRKALTKEQLDQGRARAGNPDLQSRAAPSAGRSQSVRRQGQPHSGRQNVCRAAQALRVPVRNCRHPQGARSPPPVRANALPRTHRLGRARRRRTALEGVNTSAEGGRPRSTTRDQPGART